MIFSRVLFLFGSVFGSILWEKSTRERDFRRLVEAIQQFHRDLGAPSVGVAHEAESVANPDFQPSGQVETAVRFVSEKSNEIQGLTKAKLPMGRKT
jgi:hypothetical protein